MLMPSKINKCQYIGVLILMLLIANETWPPTRTRSLKVDAKSLPATKYWTTSEYIPTPPNQRFQTAIPASEQNIQHEVKHLTRNIKKTITQPASTTSISLQPIPYLNNIEYDLRLRQLMEELVLNSGKQDQPDTLAENLEDEYSQQQHLIQEKRAITSPLVTNTTTARPKFTIYNEITTNNVKTNYQHHQQDNKKDLVSLASSKPAQVVASVERKTNKKTPALNTTALPTLSWASLKDSSSTLKDSLLNLVLLEYMAQTKQNLSMALQMNKTANKTDKTLTTLADAQKLRQQLEFLQRNAENIKKFQQVEERNKNAPTSAMEWQEKKKFNSQHQAPAKEATQLEVNDENSETQKAQQKISPCDANEVAHVKKKANGVKLDASEYNEDSLMYLNKIALNATEDGVKASDYQKDTLIEDDAKEISNHGKLQLENNEAQAFAGINAILQGDFGKNKTEPGEMNIKGIKDNIEYAQSSVLTHYTSQNEENLHLKNAQIEGNESHTLLQAIPVENEMPTKLTDLDVDLLMSLLVNIKVLAQGNDDNILKQQVHLFNETLENLQKPIGLNFSNQEANEGGEFEMITPEFTNNMTAFDTAGQFQTVVVDNTTEKGQPVIMENVSDIVRNENVETSTINIDFEELASTTIPKIITSSTDLPLGLASTSAISYVNGITTEKSVTDELTTTSIPYKESPFTESIDMDNPASLNEFTAERDMVTTELPTTDTVTKSTTPTDMLHLKEDTEDILTREVIANGTLNNEPLTTKIPQHKNEESGNKPQSTTEMTTMDIATTRPSNQISTTSDISMYLIATTELPYLEETTEEYMEKDMTTYNSITESLTTELPSTSIYTTILPKTEKMNINYSNYLGDLNEKSSYGDFNTEFKNTTNDNKSTTELPHTKIKYSPAATIDPNAGIFTTQLPLSETLPSSVSNLKETSTEPPISDDGKINLLNKVEFNRTAELINAEEESTNDEVFTTLNPYMQMISTEPSLLDLGNITTTMTLDTLKGEEIITTTDTVTTTEIVSYSNVVNPTEMATTTEIVREGSDKLTGSNEIITQTERYETAIKPLDVDLITSPTAELTTTEFPKKEWPKDDLKNNEEETSNHRKFLQSKEKEVIETNMVNKSSELLNEESKTHNMTNNEGFHAVPSDMGSFDTKSLNMKIVATEVSTPIRMETTTEVFNTSEMVTTTETFRPTSYEMNTVMTTLKTEMETTERTTESSNKEMTADIQNTTEFIMTTEMFTDPQTMTTTELTKITEMETNTETLTSPEMGSTLMPTLFSKIVATSEILPTPDVTTAISDMEIPAELKETTEILDTSEVDTTTDIARPDDKKESIMMFPNSEIETATRESTNMVDISTMSSNKKMTTDITNTTEMSTDPQTMTTTEMTRVTKMETNTEKFTSPAMGSTLTPTLYSKIVATSEMLPTPDVTTAISDMEIPAELEETTEMLTTSEVETTTDIARSDDKNQSIMMFPNSEVETATRELTRVTKISTTTEMATTLETEKNTDMGGPTDMETSTVMVPNPEVKTAMKELKNFAEMATTKENGTTLENEVTTEMARTTDLEMNTVMFPNPQAEIPRRELTKAKTATTTEMLTTLETEKATEMLRTTDMETTTVMFPNSEAETSTTNLVKAAEMMTATEMLTTTEVHTTKDVMTSTNIPPLDISNTNISDTLFKEGSTKYLYTVSNIEDITTTELPISVWAATEKFDFKVSVSKNETNNEDSLENLKSQRQTSFLQQTREPSEVKFTSAEFPITKETTHALNKNATVLPNTEKEGLHSNNKVGTTTDMPNRQATIEDYIENTTELPATELSTIGYSFTTALPNMEQMTTSSQIIEEITTELTLKEEITEDNFEDLPNINFRTKKLPKGEIKEMVVNEKTTKFPQAKMFTATEPNNIEFVIITTELPNTDALTAELQTSRAGSNENSISTELPIKGLLNSYDSTQYMRTGLPNQYSATNINYITSDLPNKEIKTQEEIQKDLMRPNATHFSKQSSAQDSLSESLHIPEMPIKNLPTAELTITEEPDLPTINYLITELPDEDGTKSGTSETSSAQETKYSSIKELTSKNFIFADLLGTEETKADMPNNKNVRAELDNGTKSKAFETILKKDLIPEPFTLKTESNARNTLSLNILAEPTMELPTTNMLNKKSRRADLLETESPFSLSNELKTRMELPITHRLAMNVDAQRISIQLPNSKHTKQAIKEIIAEDSSTEDRRTTTVYSQKKPKIAGDIGKDNSKAEYDNYEQIGDAKETSISGTENLSESNILSDLSNNLQMKAKQHIKEDSGKYSEKKANPQPVNSSQISDGKAELQWGKLKRTILRNKVEKIPDGTSVVKNSPLPQTISSSSEDSYTPTKNFHDDTTIMNLPSNKDNVNIILQQLSRPQTRVSLKDKESDESIFSAELHTKYKANQKPTPIKDISISDQQLFSSTLPSASYPSLPNDQSQSSVMPSLANASKLELVKPQDASTSLDELITIIGNSLQGTSGTNKMSQHEQNGANECQDNGIKEQREQQQGKLHEENATTAMVNCYTTQTMQLTTLPSTTTTTTRTPAAITIARPTTNTKYRSLAMGNRKPSALKSIENQVGGFVNWSTFKNNHLNRDSLTKAYSDNANATQKEQITKENANDDDDAHAHAAAGPDGNEQQEYKQQQLSYKPGNVGNVKDFRNLEHVEGGVVAVPVPDEGSINDKDIRPKTKVKQDMTIAINVNGTSERWHGKEQLNDGNMEKYPSHGKGAIGKFAETVFKIYPTLTDQQEGEGNGDGYDDDDDDDGQPAKLQEMSTIENKLLALTKNNPNDMKAIRKQEKQNPNSKVTMKDATTSYQPPYQMDINDKMARDKAYKGNEKPAMVIENPASPANEVEINKNSGNDAKPNPEEEPQYYHVRLQTNPKDPKHTLDSLEQEVEQLSLLADTFLETPSLPDIISEYYSNSFLETQKALQAKRLKPRQQQHQKLQKSIRPLSIEQRPHEAKEEITPTNWWHSLSYTEITKFLNPIEHGDSFTSSTIGLGGNEDISSEQLHSHFTELTTTTTTKSGDKISKPLKKRKSQKDWSSSTTDTASNWYNILSSLI